MQSRVLAVAQLAPLKLLAVIFAATTITVAVALLFAPQAQAAAPNGFTSQTYSDNDANGTIDRVVVVINGGEALTTCTVDAGELATDWTYTGGATFGGSIASASCVTATATITFTISGATASVTGGGTAPTIAYDNDDADNSIANASGNLGSVVAASASDGAAPVVVSVSPASAATGVNRTSNIVITFSEPMVTTFDFGTEFSISPSIGGTWSASFTVSNTVVTLNPTTTLSCLPYTLTTTEAQIDASAGTPTVLVTTGPEDGDWTFTVGGCGSSSGGGGGTSTAVAYGVNVTAPTGGASYEAGDMVTITWSDTSTNGGNFSFVDISYSLNGGSYVSIADNVADGGTYSFALPDVVGNVVFKVEATDLATSLASDLADGFITVGAEAAAEEEPADEQEAPEGLVAAGTFIRGESFTTIYYVDSLGYRRPFYNSVTFYTWTDSFNDVEVLSDADLTLYPVGGAMLPKTGTVLVKLQSVPKVYALVDDGMGGVDLRWITSETVARELYGTAWADYVIDIPDTMFPRFGLGADVDSSTELTVDRDSMYTRVWLAR